MGFKLLGTFGNQVKSGRHAGKYISYTAEDFDNYLLDLFDKIEGKQPIRILVKLKDRISLDPLKRQTTCICSHITNLIVM